ncbi:MAG: polysaccharide deacetylase family protein [Bacillota bacterium]
MGFRKFAVCALAFAATLFQSGTALAAHLVGLGIGRGRVQSLVQRPVPVLMYHVIGDGPNELFVSENDFKQQMEFLARNGYRSVTAARYVEALNRHEPLPEKSVVITFDDGYEDVYTKGFATMRKLGLVGVAFVCSRSIGRPHHVSWEQLKEMAAAGWEIGCHSATHPDLTKLDEDSLYIEVVQAKREIEEKLGVKVKSFCYPSGRYDSRVIQMVRSAGYSAAFTVDPRWCSFRDKDFERPRLRVGRSQSLEGFKRMMFHVPSELNRKVDWR